MANSMAYELCGLSSVPSRELILPTVMTLALTQFHKMKRYITLRK